MCGIVGYVGGRQAFPILIEGLEKLEYRGYDSAGVCILKHESAYGRTGNMEIIKSEGRVSKLKALAAGQDTSGSCGIAHTRWATHGDPCTANAHPHVSMSGNLAIVHNGIILEIKDDCGRHRNTKLINNLFSLFFDIAIYS